MGDNFPFPLTAWNNLKYKNNKKKKKKNNINS